MAPPFLAFLFEGRRVPLPSGNADDGQAAAAEDGAPSVLHLGPEPDSVEAVRSMAQRALNLSPGTFDLHDGCGRIEHLKDLQRAVHMSGQEGECIIEVREHALASRCRMLEAESSGLAGRVVNLEAQLGQMQEAVLNDLCGRTASLETRLAEGLKRAQSELSLVSSSASSFREEVNRRLTEFDRLWSTDRVALTLVVDQAVKYCNNGLRDLDQRSEERLSSALRKCDHLPSAEEQSQKFQEIAEDVRKAHDLIQDNHKSNSFRIEGLAATIREQRKDHSSFMGQCAALFQQGLKRAEARQEDAANTLQTKVEN